MSKQRKCNRGKTKVINTATSANIVRGLASVGLAVAEAPTDTPSATVATTAISPVSYISPSMKDIPASGLADDPSISRLFGQQMLSSKIKVSSEAVSPPQSLPSHNNQCKAPVLSAASDTTGPDSLSAAANSQASASLLQLLLGTAPATGIGVLPPPESRGPSRTKPIPFSRHDMIRRHLGQQVPPLGTATRKPLHNRAPGDHNPQGGTKDVVTSKPVTKPSASEKPTGPFNRQNIIEQQTNDQSPTKHALAHLDTPGASREQPTTTGNQGRTIHLVENIERLARQLSSADIQFPITPPPSPPALAHETSASPLMEEGLDSTSTAHTLTSTHVHGFYDRFVLNNTNVRFGGGLAVELVTTPFEPTRIVVSGISPKLEWRDLGWYLLSFGKVIHYELKHEEPGSYGKTARIRFAHHQEAAGAINELDGHPGLVTDIPLLAKYDTSIAPNCTSANIVADGVIIRWQIPAPKLRLYYRSGRVAKEEVDVINKRVFRGRQLRATLRSSQHVIIVEGLAWDSDLQEIKRRHCPDNEPAFLENHYNHSEVMEQMRNLFQGAHPRHFDIKETEKEVVIYSNFASQSDAEGFLKSFGELDLPWKGPARLCVIRAWNLVYVMQTDKYLALQASIRDLAAKLQQVDIRLRVSTPSGHTNFRHIQVRGGDHVKAYKSMIDAILVGHTVTREGKPLWDVDLEFLYGPRLFSDLQMEGVQVFMDIRRQRIMLLCTDDRRAAATHRIYRRFDDAKQRLCTHTFQRWQLRYFLASIEQILVPRFGRCDVLLDTRTCKVTVGGVFAGRCLKEIASRAPEARVPIHTQVPELSAVRCPVCLDVPSEPVSLACRHQFCKACLTQYLLSATQPEAAFPIRCFGNEGQCTLEIPLNVIRGLLTRDEFDLATSRSLKLHIDSKPDEYQHCPTNDCPQIYRIRPKTETPELAKHCPSCLNKFCPACFLEGGHDGITCAKAFQNQQLASLEEKQIVEEWVRNLGGRACPKCKMGLIKDGGCAHVQCSKCKVHICWTCGKTFDQVADESVYEHMRREHGSIGLIDWEGDGWNGNDMMEWIEPPVIPPQSSGSSGDSPVAAGGRANSQRRGQNKRPWKNRKRRANFFREYDDDGLSEDEDDDFGGGQWDYDFADVNWEAL